MVHEGQDGGAVEQQSFTLAGVGHIAKLVRRNAQLFGKNLPVSARLVEHIHEVGVFKDVLHLAAAQKVFDVLRDTGRDAAPFTESLPDFHRISGGLFLFQQQVHLVDVITGGFVGGTVDGNTASCVIHLAAKLPPFDGCGNFFPLVETMISDKDVSDHHAIIPTMEIEKVDIKVLPLGERNLFLLVCCKLLCASAEPYVYEAVTAAFDCGGHSFTAKGKRVISEGWREIDRIFRAFLKEKPADGDGGTLPDFTEGQTFDGAEVAVTEHFTQPPKPYSEDTLLSAMENAGKDDIPDEAERKGLGTPATRAAIIEKLVAAGFVERKGKSLIPTKAGINLVTVLPEPLTSPMLTAEWEQKLTEIAKGGADPDTFMDGIRTMVQEIVSTYSCISEDGKKLFAPEKEVIGTCPRCGQPVYEGKKNFACSDRSCGFVLWKNDRFWTSRKKELTKKMAADLLKKGHTNVKGMWSEKKQAAYDAAVILDDTGGKYINFKLEFPKRKEGVNGRK